jgi:hypothetical protein
MKTLKRIGAIAVMALSLGFPVYADATTPGDSHSPGCPTPITSETSTDTTTDTTLTGETVVIDDGSLLTLEDMLWILVSIY